MFFWFLFVLFFFVVLFLQNKCKWWKKYRITKSQLQMGYMEKLWSLLVTKIFRWCLLPKWKILYPELLDCFSTISIQSKVSCLLLSKIFYKVYVPHWCPLLLQVGLKPGVGKNRQSDFLCCVSKKCSSVCNKCLLQLDHLKPKTSLPVVILLPVCLINLIILAWRIWYWINQ